MKSSAWLMLVVVAAPGLAAAAETPLMSADECAVWNRELSFAQSVDNHDAKAFAEHVHPGAVFNVASAATVRGREAVVADWANIIEGKEFRLVWRPHYVSIGGDPNIAASRGPFYLHNPDPKAKAPYVVGTFSSVWVRANKRTPWQVLFDGGGTPPSPVANEAEALAYLAKAPAACPMK